MAAETDSQPTRSVSDRFPNLKPLEEEAERAKLSEQVAKARAGAISAQLPALTTDVAHDSLTVDDKKTGLGQVLVQFDTVALVDDVADLVLDALRTATPGRPRRYRVRVVDDPSALRGVDRYVTITAQIKAFQDRVTSFLPPDDRHNIVVAAIPAFIGLGVQAIGLVTKLMATEYHVSGSAVPVEGIPVDLLLAQELEGKTRSDEEVHVRVDRLEPTPRAAVLDDLLELARLAEFGVSKGAGAAYVDAARAEAEVRRAEGAVTALDGQIQKLVERLPDGTAGTPGTGGAVAAELDALRKRRDEWSEQLPDLSADVVRHRLRYDEGRALIAEITDFLTAALAPGPNGQRSSAIEAARAEFLTATDDRSPQESAFVVYLHLLAGGVDTSLETRLGPDRWGAVAGATVEFAVLDREGGLLASGVRSLLQASTATLNDFTESFQQHYVNYVGIRRRTDDIPTDPGSSSDR